MKKSVSRASNLGASGLAAEPWALGVGFRGDSAAEPTMILALGMKVRRLIVGALASFSLSLLIGWPSLILDIGSQVS